MSEQRRVMDELRDAHVLAAIAWAYLSATNWCLDTYSETEALDMTWLGMSRFILFRDRLDRVFSCEDYTVPVGSEAANLDVLYRDLPTADIESMPHLGADSVRRANLNGSPGWAHGARRFLLASGEYGKLTTLPWPRKSPTKQHVARQQTPDPGQPTLFEGFAPDEVGGLSTLSAQNELDLVTFVVAHSLDPVDARFELIFGRPRLNAGGGEAWHWRQDLLDMPGGGTARRIDGLPTPPSPSDIQDAPVRLRRQESERPNSTEASGDQ